MRERKTLKLNTTTLEPSKMSLESQNLKTEHNGRSIADNRFQRAEHDKWTHRTQNRRK
jgi:hypothetical protein